MNVLTKDNDFVSVSELMASMPAHWQENYLGVWAIQESFLRDVVSRFGGVDMPLHIQANAADIKAELQQIKGGYSVDMSDDGLAVVQLSGATSKHYNSFTRSTSTLMMRKTLRTLRRETAVRGVVLHIDSPGGAVAGQKAFADEVAALAAEKPVFAFIEDLGASAAYWTASQASRIYANDMAVVGSVGTYGVVHDSSEMADKMGIKVHVLRAGKMKGAGTPGTEITHEHLAKFQREIVTMNEFFMAAVANGRSLSLSRVQTLATGDVWIGEEALGVGLIDEIGTLDSVVQALREKVGGSGRYVAQVPQGDMQMSDEQREEYEARVTELESELQASQEAASVADVKIRELEADAMAQRFSALVGEGGDAWAGERETHLTMLSVLAGEFGEDSAEFKAYLRQQKALTAQLADSVLFKQVGGDADDAGDVNGRLEKQARTLAKEKGITYEQAYSQLLNENPNYYQEMKTAV